jgi:hypothetical protein
MVTAVILDTLASCPGATSNETCVRKIAPILLPGLLRQFAIEDCANVGLNLIDIMSFARA